MKFASIALRNLTRQKRRSLLLAGAIAVGIFIVTLVNAFTAGTVQVLKENMADLIGGHVFVTVQHKEGDKTIDLISDDAKLMGVVKSLGITDAMLSKTVDLSGTLIFNGKTTAQIMVGAKWTPDSGIKAKLAIADGDFAKAVAIPNGVILSKKTADTLKLQLGDSLLLKCKTVTGQENVGEFVIGYITSDTSQFGGMVAFANRDYINQLANLPNLSSYLTLRVRLASLEEAPAFAARLEAELAKQYQIAPKEASMMSMDANVIKVNQTSEFKGERVKVETINDMLSEITSLSTGLAIASLIMLVFLLLITMIGIANTFRMILYERIQEIGAMRALGMQRGEVRTIMLYEAVFLSLLGVVLGVALAGLAMLGLGIVNFGTDSLFAILLNNGHLSFRFDAASMLISTVLVVVFTWFAALGPSNKAARLLPADALRTSY